MTTPIAELRSAYAAQFQARSVVENYRCRPPYAPEVYATLERLMVAPRRVLDAGCGPGKIALGLLDAAEHIDAVDPSEEMLTLARSLAGGDSGKISWICARIEDAVLTGPYGLICAGASFHWMEAGPTLDLFARLLAPGGVLALVEGDAPADPPWRAAELEIFSDFILRLQGQLPNFPKSSAEQLRRPLLLHPQFEPLGATITAPFIVRQTLDDYLCCQHSRATWAPENMGEGMMAEFDARLGALLAPYLEDGMLAFAVQQRIEWGRPLGY